MPVTRGLPLLLVVLLSSAAVAHGQPPAGGGQGGGRGLGAPRDGAPASPAQVGTGSISGAVVVAGTGQPARRVRVTLNAPDGGSGRSSLTDDDGRFTFAGLPSGRYTLGASKPGHVGVTYGQTQPGRPGTPIQLGDGQKFSALLQLPKGGVITGTVVDEYSDPTAGTQVRVMRYVTQTGRRTLQQAGAAATDDRGIYRVFGLQPGEYIVSAVPRNAGPRPDVGRLQAEIQAVRERVAGDPSAALPDEVAARVAMLQAQLPRPDEPGSGYAPVYYPGVVSAAQAAPVVLGVGEERLNVDFQLQRMPMARIEGTVINATDQPVQNVQLTLVDAAEDVPSIGRQSTRADAEGRFRFGNVPPGNYRLVARATAPGARGVQFFDGRDGRGAIMVTPGGGRGGRGAALSSMALRLWGGADVPVDGRDITDLVLTLQHGLSVSGRVVFDGTAAPPADVTRIRVTLTPADPIPGLSQPAAAALDASGRFTVASVLPGTYRMTAAGAGTGWTLESSIIEGQDTLDFPFEVKPGAAVTSAVLTFSDRRAGLSGTITNQRGEPAPAFTLILYASDERYWAPQSRRVRATRPATDGRFTFTDVPPGEYRLAAVVDVEQGAWYDPTFLHQMDAASLAITIREGEAKVQNLQVHADAAATR